MKTMLLLCALIVGSSSVWATTEEGTFIIDFYDSEKLTSTSGTGLTNSNYSSFVEVPEGATATGVVTSVSVTGTVRYGMNGGLTAGTSTAASANTHYVTFNIASSYAVKKCTVYATAYDSGRWLLNGNAASSGSLGDKGTAIANVTSPLIWNFATGQTSLTFKKDNGSNGNQKRLTIYRIVCEYGNVSNTPVTGVTVAPTSWELMVGESKALAATVSPVSATNKNISWESDDEDVATVTSSGVVKAVSAGTAKITVTTEDGSKTATCDVTVIPVPPVAITLDFTSGNILGLPTSGTTDPQGFNYGGYTYTFAASTAYYQSNSGYVMLGKSGSTLTFPAFPFDVTAIRVHGTSGASTAVVQNIYVGDTPVSTATTGAKGVINRFDIATSNQAAGTIYVLKVTSEHNTQISKIEIIGKEKTSAVSAAGWATYVTKNPVSFTEGDAFAVTSVGSSVGLTAVTDVPKDTPLLLKGAGAKTAAVLDADPAAITNKLAVSNGTSGVNDYVLANHGGQVGFYKWTGSALASGKVYLPASEVPAGTREFFGFDDEATGIANINGEAKTLFNGEFYNIAGQRVAQPNKGLYIVNGKKVIIK